MQEHYANVGSGIMALFDAVRYSCVITSAVVLWSKMKDVTCWMGIL